MLKFNTLLEAGAINPKDVQLVRHQDGGPTGVTPYSLLCNAPDQFDHYQSIQSRAVFRRTLLASFVVTPAAETMFVNLYAAGSPQRNAAPEICPVKTKLIDAGKLWKYPLSVDDRLGDFSKRLTIEWGGGRLPQLGAARRSAEQRRFGNSSTIF